MVYFINLFRERGTIKINLIKVPTCILRMKICRNDPIFYSVKKIVQWIKGTLGITGWWFLRVPIEEIVWHLDVGSSYPKHELLFKGSAVRRLKWYMSWV